MRGIMSSDKLTDKQALFVKEYLIDLNATQAAIRAGYSENTAQKIGSENLSKPLVSAAISEAMKERTEALDIDAQWLLQRLVDEANADVADLYTEEGALKPIHMWPKIWRQGLVAGLEVQQQFEYVDGQKSPEGYLMKVKLSDRVKRMEMIGKHIDVQAFNEKSTVTIKDERSISDEELDREIIKLEEAAKEEKTSEKPVH